MKFSLILAITLSLITFGAYAEKPEWAGKGKPTAEQKAAHKAAMNAKEDDDDEDHDDDDDGEGKGKDKSKKEKMKQGKKDKKAKQDRDDDDEDEDSDRQSGLEKQKAKKAEQGQKELGKGSEKGQEARETRRKWWQFWGGEEE